MGITVLLQLPSCSSSTGSATSAYEVKAINVQAPSLTGVWNAKDHVQQTCKPHHPEPAEPNEPQLCKQPWLHVTF